MLVVHVDIEVLPGRVEEFHQACLANAQASLCEAGVLRFDVLQDRDDSTHFALVEVYADEDAPAAHKATEHYATWRDTVADMMARPRTSVKYEALYPTDAAAWDTPST